MTIYKTKLEEGENGEVVITLPNKLFEEYDWQVGDEIDVTAESGLIKLINLSLEQRRKAIL